jgi:hypothetical protein
LCGKKCIVVLSLYGTDFLLVEGGGWARRKTTIFTYTWNFRCTGGVQGKNELTSLIVGGFSRLKSAAILTARIQVICLVILFPCLVMAK